MRRESAHQHVKFDFESSILSAGRMAQPGLRRLQESPAAPTQRRRCRL